MVIFRPFLLLRAEFFELDGEQAILARAVAAKICVNLQQSLAGVLMAHHAEQVVALAKETLCQVRYPSRQG